MPSGKAFFDLLRKVPSLRVLASYRDFRILWIGTGLSFLGSQVQGAAQGFYVLDLTGSEAKTGFVVFALTAPIFFLGPFVGAFSDILDKRKVMATVLATNAVATGVLATAVLIGRAEYWHFLAVSSLIGVMATLEIPTRQSLVRLVVPDRDVATAVPTMAMTLNIARSVGSALGGFIYAVLGPAYCFFINSGSFFSLIWSAFAIKADLKPKEREPQPIATILFGGIRYVWRKLRLRVLFIMEASTSMFGAFFLPLMPIYIKFVLGLGPRENGIALAAAGLGALAAVVVLSFISHLPLKPIMVRAAMSVFALGMLAITFVRNEYVAYAIFAVMGAAQLTQFNTTNALFQLTSPDRVRGSAMAMHMWAILGSMPIGVLVFSQ
ncbi:MAG: MFS transporter, partial [Fimbriimonadaceae bacterium]